MHSDDNKEQTAVRFQALKEKLRVPALLGPQKDRLIENILDGYLSEFMAGKRHIGIGGNASDAMDDFCFLVNRTPSFTYFAHAAPTVLGDLVDKHLIVEDPFMGDRGKLLLETMFKATLVDTQAIQIQSITHCVHIEGCKLGATIVLLLDDIEYVHWEHVSIGEEYQKPALAIGLNCMRCWEGSGHMPICLLQSMRWHTNKILLPIGDSFQKRPGIEDLSLLLGVLYHRYINLSESDTVADSANTDRLQSEYDRIYGDAGPGGSK